MSNSIQFLEWDSNFFGFDVYAINSNNKTTIRNQLLQLNKRVGSLIYLYTDIVVDKELLQKFNGQFVGTKVILKKHLWEVDSNNYISSLKYKIIPSELLSLAIQSGAYSRFKLDKRLPSGSFESLYEKWLYKAIDNSKIETLVYKESDIIKGFISIEYSDEAVVGLFAVDETIRGKGIGGILLTEAEFISKSRGYSILQIPTQKENYKACDFYSKKKYKITEEKRNYHFKF